MRLISSARPRPDSGGKRSLLARAGKFTIATFGAIAIGLLGTGGTYAYLNASAASDSAVTIAAGTAALTVTNPVGITNFYPGLTQRKAFSVRNDGDVRLGLSVSSISSSNSNSQLVVSVATGDCNGTSAGITSGDLGVALDPKVSASLCLVVTLPANATAKAAGQSTNLTIDLQGTQQ
jgi:predicted ribosomally synthesized peptide with SipW-like signal peptide